MTPPRKTTRRSARSRREFYSIGEVCAMLDLKPHVVRYWESQFEQLAPSKNRAGNRVYRPEDIEFITRVRHLVHEERFTIEGARQQLRDTEPGTAARADVLPLPERAFLASLRAQLEGVQELLTPPAR